MTSWHTYPKIYNLGHRAIENLLSVPVNVEEKIDGSQFSFSNYEPDGPHGGLRIRSKGAEMHIDAPEGMFQKAAETVRSLAWNLHPCWTYRCEYLAKPKHNALCYDRTPDRHLILFDVNTGDNQYLSYEDKRIEAQLLGLECVPLLYSGKLEKIGDFRRFLETESVLGGQKIEGVVIKPRDYDLICPHEHKVLMGKFVSEHFREVHSGAGKSAPQTGDLVAELGDKYCSAARWQKALLHLREAGQIENAPKDIGKLIQETARDVQAECGDEIKQALFDAAWKQMHRRITHGLPEWYKEQLLKAQFGEGA